MNRRSFLYSGAALGVARPSPAAPAKDVLLEKVARAALSPDSNVHRLPDRPEAIRTAAPRDAL